MVKMDRDDLLVNSIECVVSYIMYPPAMHWPIVLAAKNEKNAFHDDEMIAGLDVKRVTAHCLNHFFLNGHNSPAQ